MERLFDNPEWNDLADESRLHEPGIVEDQITRVWGRMLHLSKRTIDPTLPPSEVEQSALELNQYSKDLSVLLQQPGVITTYESYLINESIGKNPLGRFHAFRERFGI